MAFVSEMRNMLSPLIRGVFLIRISQRAVPLPTSQEILKHLATFTEGLIAFYKWRDIWGLFTAVGGSVKVETNSYTSQNGYKIN